MSTRITFVEDELAHYGVKGMRWGVRRVQANMAGKKAAQQHIRGTNAFFTRTQNSATKKVTKLNKKWRGTEHESAFEKAKQRELRKQMRWHGKGYTASKEHGDAKTREIAAKEEKHKGRWAARQLGASAAISVVTIGGPIAYSVVKNKLATSNNLKVRNMYNKYAKTGIYDIKL